MCGIFAAYGTGEVRPKLAVADAAAHSVIHRGPDNLSVWGSGRCCLSHTRLAIVGLEKASNQPFHFDHLSLVFNGEIFNFIELRQELIGLGYRFDTGSDTEVVIKAFHRWGVQSFHRFNGMWSLVIFDRRTEELTVSRDRFGQKPLFYFESEGMYSFASEVHQLFCVADLDPDFELIQQFLKEGTYDGQGRTFFKGVFEFPKAHFCVIDRSGRIRTERYWRYWEGDIQSSDPESFREFEHLFTEAVRLRLRVDVPCGVLLSGGVDSTMIAAAARKILGPSAQLPAFTYGAHDESDETPFARAIASALHFPLTVRYQDDTPAAYRKRLIDLVAHMGRGHSSPAIVSVDLLYESMAQTGVRVALDGQGADELLGGYKTYQPLMVAWSLSRGHWRDAALFARDMMREGVVSVGTLFLRNLLPDSLKSLGRRAYGYEGLFSRLRKQGPAHQPIRRDDNRGYNRNPLNRYLIHHHDVGLENLLYYGDIAAMKNSVENRSPFMDHRLVDFVFARDEGLKVGGAVDKTALRRLPVYQRFRTELDRRKIGFSSDLRPVTKLALIEELRASPILTWPIFSSQFSSFVCSSTIESPKFERLFFRAFQLHLWYEQLLSRRQERREAFQSSDRAIAIGDR